MNLSSVRIITKDIQPLVEFYEKVTGSPLVIYTADFAELRTAQATLAIGSIKTLALFAAADIAQPAANRSAIIEFGVEDVDSKYSEIAEYIKDGLVQPPTTMPWGNRSLLFRDPDGNLVNFFTPVTSEGKQRANS
jgi:catechol 2,3-dioxygenase-like lactoylglutathione lyase family enzyme